MWRLVGDSQGWLYSAKELMTSENDTTHYWSADWNLRPASPVRRHLSSQFFLRLSLSVDYFDIGFRKPIPVCHSNLAWYQILDFYRSTCLGPGKFSVQDLHSPE